MAILSIPTSVGGVSIPGGLLAGPLGALFGSNKNKGILQYPIDLASNPARSHSVAFSIYDIEPVNNTEKTKAVVDKGVVDKQIATTLQPPYQKIKSQIFLYMPDTLNISYSADYQEFSLTNDLGPAGFMASAGLDAYEKFKSGGANMDSAKNALKGVMDSEGMAVLAGGALGKAGVQNAGDYLLRSQGKLVNPQIQLMYKGVGLRQFQLEFLMTPKSKAEAQAIKDIIDVFTYHFSPSVKGLVESQQGQYLSMPSKFNVDFRFSGTSGALGSIINSALGSLGGIGSAISAANPPTGKPNDSLYKVGDCALTDMSVDYAPNGWASFADGNPVATRLTLSFKEMNILTREDLGGKLR